MKKKISTLKSKIKELWQKYSFLIIVILLSLAIFIIGGFVMGFIKSLIFTIILDILCFVITKMFLKPNKSKLEKLKPDNIKQDNEINNENNEEKNIGEVMKTKKKVVKKSKEKKKKKKTLWKVILLAIFSIGILLVLGFIGFIFLVIKSAPKFDTSKLYNQQASILYDRNGEVFAKLGTEKREIISYDNMSEVLVDAIIATEDSRFFQHNGFDLPRFLKASVGQLMGRNVGGASTITMQISKQRFTSTESQGIKGIIRKFTDIYMAVFKIEKHYTKKEILEIYANSFYMGAGAFGVEQASQTYFNKSAKDLNLAEAAMIAGMFQAPDAYDPFTNPEKTEARRKTVLYLMHLHGYITDEEKEIATAMTVDKLLRKSTTSSNQYAAFINTVVSEVTKITGKDPYTTSMKIYTTMDREKQDTVNKLMNGETFAWANDVVQGAVALLSVENGEIIAIGAGHNYSKVTDYNRATQIKRQIGSTAKPVYDYGPAIEYNNLSTYGPIVDEPYTYSNGVKMYNFDKKYQGLITARKALMGSRNIPALKTFQTVDNAKIKEFVENLGLSPETGGGSVHEAHSIGGYNGESPLKMAAAYAAFANGGYYNEPHSFTKIIFRDTSEEYERQFIKRRAMSVETAYMVADMLLDTSVSALGTYSNIGGGTFGAKTGTTNFSQETIKQYGLSSKAINDLWVTGFNKDYAMSVWYGYDSLNKEHPEYATISGNQSHKKIFQTLAKSFFKGKTTLEKPSGVITVGIEKETMPAMLPSAYTPSDMIVYELFKKGSEPTDVSNRYSQLSNVTNLTATLKESTVTLSWTPIATPSAIDRAALSNYFASIYRSDSDRNTYLNKRLEYNNAYIGTLGYSIYKKNEDGSLQRLGYTNNSTYNYTLADGEQNVKFIVKSEYSIFKSNASSGVEAVYINQG